MAGAGIGNAAGILIVGGLFFFLPLWFTYINVKKLVLRSYERSGYDYFTAVIGLIYSGILFGMMYNPSGKDYYEAIYPDQMHNILHSEYSGVIEAMLFLACISYFVLITVRPEKMPPLFSLLVIAFCYVGLILGALLIIQSAADFEIYSLMFVLYWVNLLVIVVRHTRGHISQQVRYANEHETTFRSKFGAWLHKKMCSVSSMTAMSFLMILPIAVIAELLYIILGQGADGFIKAFTMTADWTFSTQTPPPPLEFEGHYLCTVAAGGHSRVVKPLRFGVRRGERIVVNRQLLAANAFEDLIMERAPRFHRAVRGFYDKYGYPVSKHITTKVRADIVYLLMKPLECVFVIILYLFDAHPENRIAVQYSEYKRN